MKTPCWEENCPFETDPLSLELELWEAMPTQDLYIMNASDWHGRGRKAHPRHSSWRLTRDLYSL